MGADSQEDGLGGAAGDAVGADSTDGEPAAGEGGEGGGKVRGGGRAAVSGQRPVDLLVLYCHGALGPEAAPRRHSARPSPLRVHPPRMRLLTDRRRPLHRYRLRRIARIQRHKQLPRIHVIRQRVADLIEARILHNSTVNFVLLRPR